MRKKIMSNEAVRVFFFGFAICAAISQNRAIAAGIDDALLGVPAGIVFPSQHSAIYDDPAALAGVKSGNIVGQAHFPNNLSELSLLEGSVSKGFGGVGAGGGVRYFDGGRVLGGIAVGAGTQSFQAGLNLQSDFDEVVGEVDLGLRFGNPQKLVGAFVLKDLTGAFFRYYDLGIGAHIDMFVLEVDLSFIRNSGAFSFSSIENKLAFLLVPNERITLKLGFTNTLVPDFRLFSRPIEVGGMFWVTKELGIQAGINTDFAAIMVGATFQF